MQLAPINLDPEELIANYKPLPQLDIKKKKSLEEIDALATSMKTKNMRYNIQNYLLFFYFLRQYFTGQKYTLEIKAQFIQKFLV